MSRKNVGARLPGVRFEVQEPPLAEVLPRMDVTVFVGFAASGPVGVPVAVADAAQFAAVFGDDTPLAADPERGEPARAYLASAVRSFFVNGGRRCWVVRVARDARSNRFPLPAMLARRGGGALAPAFAVARSEGSWSDALRVGASLKTRAVEVTKATPNDLSFELAPSSPGDVRAGDLLRFSFRDEGFALLAVVTEAATTGGGAQSPPGSSPNRRAVVSVRCGDALWCRTRWLSGSGFDPLPATASVIGGVGPPPPPVAVAEWSFSELEQSVTALLSVPLSGAPREGDRIRLDFGDAELQFTARTVEAGETLSPPEPGSTRVVGRNLRWLLPQPTGVTAFTSPTAVTPLPHAGRPSVEGGLVSLDLALGLTSAPQVGSVIRVDFGARRLWLTVQGASARRAQVGGGAVVRVAGRGFWSLDSPPPVLPGALPACERLSFDLLARQNGDEPLRLGDLGFAPGHARYWGAWPTDAERFRPHDEYPEPERHPASIAAEFFPLAGSDQDDEREVYYPVAMPFVVTDYLGAVASGDDALVRDGLSVFDEELFLDPKLVDTGTEGLMAEADFIRYQSNATRRLTGIHAALSIEEATIIAVPDAVHRGWSRRDPGEAEAQPSEKIHHPEWRRFGDCNAQPAVVAEADDAEEEGEPTAEDEKPAAGELKPDWGKFIDCCVRPVPAPQFKREDGQSSPTPYGTVALSWDEIEGAEYVLEESPVADWDGSVVVYRGRESGATLYGRAGGVYYYRVRAEVCGSTSEWSDGLAVRLDSTQGWGLRAREDYNPRALLALQRALLRMCAARGDLLAVLTLPEHYREDDAITHAANLSPAKYEDDGSGTLSVSHDGSRVRPLGRGEERALSYGALYHPWLVGSRPGVRSQWERVPPDGAACGVLAERALTRGAWVAPANELLRGVVALSPGIAPERRLDLQEARVNLARQEPRGFVVLCADTLSADEDLRPINVRRLLILLRRLALRLGSRYVFEPNDGTFRRGVQRGFEAMLGHMHARGAFAGRTAATSFQVVTDETLNTPQSVEQGRFIVELKVAPSLPLRFLTVRLVQTGDRSQVTEAI